MKPISKQLDKYYTKKEICTFLLNRLNAIYPIGKFDIVIEPSSGNGDIFKEILKYNNNVIGFDLYPDYKHQNIYQYDFLEVNENIFKDFENKLLISNPPYNRNILYKFIKHSVKFANVICMILPKSFKNNRNLNTIPVNFHIIDIIDLPKNSFYNDNEEYDINTIFMILEKRDYNRDKLNKQIPLYYKFVKKDTPNAISIRRVGFNASKIIDIEKSNKNTCYYILLEDEIDTNKFLLEYNKINFKIDISNNVGSYSLPKYKLINKLNALDVKIIMY